MSGEIGFVVGAVWGIFRGLWKSHQDRKAAEDKLDALSILGRPSHVSPHTTLLTSELTRMNLAANTKQPEGGDKVNTNTLVVGQDVYMFKPPYPFWFCIEEGKVVKVTPEGVDVQVVDRRAANAAYCQRKDRGDKAIKIAPSRVEVQVADLQSADLIRFDTSGKETDVSRRNRLGFGPSPNDKFYTFLWQSAPEFAPWHLDDMPFEERTALLEQRTREVKVAFEQKDRDNLAG